MFLIVGLGNPGLKYKYTRHNAGFMALDALADVLNVRVNKKRFEGVTGETQIGGEKVVLLKPHTFMNLSGDSVREALEFYKLPTRQMIVCYDDIDLDFGRLRIKASGSAGTHNGMRSIIGAIRTYDFPRVRIGIGKNPPYMDLAAYVTSKLDKTLRGQLEEAGAKAAQACECIIRQGVEAAQAQFNGKAGGSL